MEIAKFTTSVNAININDPRADQLMSEREPSWNRKPSFRRGNYYILSNGDDAYFLIIKISRNLRPFWGVGENFLNFTLGLNTKLILVLLDSEHSGWIYFKDEISFFLKRGKWSYSNGQYKINYNKLIKNNQFNSPTRFISLINLNN